VNPFHWLESATVKIDASTTSANAALLKMPTGITQIRLYNSGSVPVFIRKGTDSTVTGLISDMPIAPGSVEVLTLNNNPTAPITHVAAITASGTASLYVTVGQGL